MRRLRAGEGRERGGEEGRRGGGGGGGGEGEWLRAAGKAAHLRSPVPSIHQESRAAAVAAACRLPASRG